jgi:hypothetical protein
VVEWLKNGLYFCLFLGKRENAFWGFFVKNEAVFRKMTEIFGCVAKNGCFFGKMMKKNSCFLKKR